METTKYGQVFYEAEANALRPESCRCPDRSGSCGMCLIREKMIGLGLEAVS